MYAITIVETGRVAILELLPDIRLFKYFSTNYNDASKSALLYS